MLVLLVAVLLAGIGVGRPPAVRSTVYREAIVAPPGPSVLSTLLLPQDPVAQAVAALTAPGLLVGGWRGQPVPGLAATWRAEDGGRRYAFTLRPGARWSTGRPVTMGDVAFTLRVLQSPRLADQGSTSAWTGVRLVVSGPRGGAFVLPGPSAAFPVAAEAPVLPFRPYGGRPGRYLLAAEAPAGPPPPAAGPFVVARDGVGAVWLHRNPWARPRPRLGSVVLVREAGPSAARTALRRGWVDGWLAATPTGLGQLPPGLRAHRLTSFAFVAILLNERAQPLGDIRLRRALAAVVNRAALVRQALGGLGVPQVGPIPVSIGWAQPRPGTLPPVVPAAAQLAADGWVATRPGAVRTRGGRPLRLRLTVPDLPPLPAVAATLRRQFRAAGVALTVQLVPQGTLVASVLQPGHFQMALVGFDNGPDPDVRAFWHSGLPSSRSLDFSGGPPDPVLNRDLDVAATTPTRSVRAALYGQVARLLALDAPAIFLYTPVAVYLQRSAVRTPPLPSVGDPAARFWAVARWRIG